jgi:RND superfamily putative drug exporter
LSYDNFRVYGCSMSRLARIGTFCARRPGRVLAAWLLAAIALLAGSHLAGGTYSDQVRLGGTQASAGLGLLQAHDPAAGGYTGLVVVDDPHGAMSQQASTVSAAAAALGRLPHVLAARDPLASTPPTVSASGAITYFDVQLNVSPKTLGPAYVHDLDQATAGLRQAGDEVNYGGDFDQLTRPKAADGRSELIGLAVALIVLLIGFGSVMAAVLPLLSAMIAVVAGVGILGLAAGALTFGTASPTLAVMIGLGVGIDYALFLTTRFRQQVMDGADPVLAAGATAGSSGHAVLVAASTVSVAMVGLYASGVSFIGQLGLAAVFAVVSSAAGALTLVPAALGWAGRRIDRLAVRRPVAETGQSGDGWHRYAAAVGRHPWRYLLAGLALLVVIGSPVLSLRVGHVDDGADPASFTDKRAYDQIAQGFGPGANGTFTVVVDLTHSKTPLQTVSQDVASALSGAKGVARVAPPHPSPDGQLLITSLVPATGPQSAATASLFHSLVDTTLPRALAGTGAAGYITGSTATFEQFAQVLQSRLPIVIAVVVATAFLLILATFRSLLLAIKAALLNLVSIAAAYGVLVAVFQWGWGSSLLGVSEAVPIESYVPVLMFAIVFGLSMDYEVFLLSRVQEAWTETTDQGLSVARGLASTGRVISCAALIMVSVFTAFVGSDVVVIKMIAIGLAVSVLIDATVVRLVLVPAVMYLLGPACWWMPRWLDRIVPRIQAEGGAGVIEVAPVEPSGGPQLAAAPSGPAG